MDPPGRIGHIEVLCILVGHRYIQYNYMYLFIPIYRITTMTIKMVTVYGSNILRE